MQNDFTHVSVVLDDSSSMLSEVDATISGFNEFLEGQKAQPGKATMTLYYINSRMKYDMIDIREVAPRDKINYRPSGSTPLLDGIGFVIDATGDKLRHIPADRRPGKIITLIITDGEENTSSVYSGELGRKRIFDKITHQRDKYGWEFTFMGCNQDAIAAAASLGIVAGNAMTYNGDHEGTLEAWRGTSRGLSSYRMAAGPTTKTFYAGA